MISLSAKGVLLGLTLCGLAAVPNLPVSPSAGSARQPARALARVERQSFELRVGLVGELAPLNSLTVSSAVRGEGGKLIELIADGSKVQQGDVIARLDPSLYEEGVRRAKTEAERLGSTVLVRNSLLEWEQAQAQRKVRTAEFDKQAAVLALHQAKQGEGPLELARLESKWNAALDEHSRYEGFADELAQLAERGLIEGHEVEEVQRKAAHTARTLELERRQLESFRDFILPTRIAALDARLERALMELEQTRISVGHKVSEARASLLLAEGNARAAIEALEDAHAQLAATVLRAPGPGLVVHRADFRDGEHRKPRVGDAVWMNQPLVLLPDLSHMLVESSVRELDLHKVEVGMQTRVTIDAYPGEHFVGRVRSIGVLAERDDARGGQKSFQLSIELEGTDPRLRPGMTARVDVLSRQVSRECCVPVEAVWNERGMDLCYVAVGTSFEEREVQLGPVGTRLAVVLSGLQEGENVSLLRPSSVQTQRAESHGE